MRFRPFLIASLSFGVLAMVTPWLAKGQPGAEVENLGKPIIVNFQCTGEEAQSSGMACGAEDPCPIYLELVSVETVGNRLFLAGNLHSNSATLESVLLASNDSGKTWREPHERIRAAGLERIQFIDFENGWVSGETLHPLPRDPFLLRTVDGGKTWAAHPVFAEPRDGSISEFGFSSRSNGSLAIDGGSASPKSEIYQTSDGGQTWTLRQTAQRPLPLSQVARATDVDWRIRADGATKSFHVEHRSSDRWRSVAAFAVEVGSCQATPGPG